MPRRDLALWGVIGLLLVGQALSGLLLYGEIADLREQVAHATGARPAAPEVALAPLPEVGGQGPVWGTELQARVTAAQPLGETATLTLTVRGSGAADLLLELPVLVCGGAEYPVDGASLEQARRALLDLITRGEATGGLLFYGGPDLSQPCTLYLNPGQSPQSVTAPRLELRVPQVAPALSP